MTLLKPVYIILLTSFLSIGANAQESNWEIGIMGGGAGYIGDLNQNNLLKVTGYSAGIYGKLNFNQYVGVRLNYNHGMIWGKDSESSNQQFRERNLKFKSSLNEVSTTVDVNFFNYRLQGGTRQFTPYLFVGVGAVLFNPTASYGGTNYDLRDYYTEGQQEKYKNIVLTLPFGGGLRYNYKNEWSVFTELGYRTAYTDYLDDVSNRYPAISSVVGESPYYYNLSDPTLNLSSNVNTSPKANTQRGDFRKRDTYLFVSVGISFTFVTSKCYSF
ncbi:type IX secretion system protein PorG [Pedobacter sp. MW01-1-1]|uniref:type IX secretion system protein PorG n=1 Tax=Pedobacter sp. MW01-1-1 TaxID=3383027 RepID=UPI003FF13797